MCVLKVFARAGIVFYMCDLNRCVFVLMWFLNLWFKAVFIRLVWFLNVWSKIVFVRLEETLCGWLAVRIQELTTGSLQERRNCAWNGVGCCWTEEAADHSQIRGWPHRYKCVYISWSGCYVYVVYYSQGVSPQTSLTSQHQPLSQVEHILKDAVTCRTVSSCHWRQHLPACPFPPFFPPPPLCPPPPPTPRPLPAQTITADWCHQRPLLTKGSVSSPNFFFFFFFFWGGGGGGDSSVVRAPDSWLKGRGFESLLERRENFLLQGRLSVLTLISVSVPPPCYHSST